jgi:hypothetical protein
VVDPPDLTKVPGDVLELAVVDAMRAIDQQASKLEEHRVRAAAILGAASIVASFLGAEALNQIDESGGVMEARAHIQIGAVAGFVSFVVVAVLACYALRPTSGWTFGRSPSKLILFITHPATKDAQAYRRFTLEDLAADHERNDAKLQPLTNAVRRSVYALAVETVGFLVALL